MTSMPRRAFLALLGGVVGDAPRVARAQQPGRIYRLGILNSTTTPAPSDQHTSAFLILKGLTELGYASGQNLAVEVRYAEGRLERLPELARELVQLGADVIVAVTQSGARAARQATTVIPIVFYGNFDPIAAGLVKSLAKPEGNLTGILIAPAGTLAGKKLELLREAVPQATRIAFLSPEDPPFQLQVRETQQAASALGIILRVTVVRHRDYERAFSSLTAERPGALFVGATAQFVRDRRQIIALAARHRLPAMYEWPEQVEDGGLMSYGSSLPGTTRRVAAYVDRLFKGDRPSDLPIEQPAEFQLAINLRTARALGLTLPSSLVARAERVIE